MKLMKTKILMIISGLLTLNGLAMLFFGLVQQMSRASNFGTAVETVHASTSSLMAILAGTLMIIAFGLVFFNSWAKLKTRNVKLFN